MKDEWLTGKRGKSGLKSIVLWGAFTCAVLAGLSATVGAALAGIGNKNDELALKLREMTAFDPFTLKTAVVTHRTDSALPTPPRLLPGLEAAAKTGSEDGRPVDILQSTVSVGVMKRPPIRIPYRPVLRSPFQPPLVPAAAPINRSG